MKSDFFTIYMFFSFLYSINITAQYRLDEETLYFYPHYKDTLNKNKTKITQPYIISEKTFCKFNNQVVSPFYDYNISEQGPFSHTYYPRHIKFKSSLGNSIDSLWIDMKIVYGIVKNIRLNNNQSLTLKIAPIDTISDISNYEDIFDKIFENKVKTHSKKLINIPSDSNVPLYGNFRALSPDDIPNWTGSRILIVLGHHGQITAIHFLSYDTRIEYTKAACSGYIVKWEKNFSKVSIWEPHNIKKLKKDLYEKFSEDSIRQIFLESDKYSKLIEQNYKKINQMEFADDFQLIIEGKYNSIKTSYDREELELDFCLFYGAAFLKFTEQGLVKDILVPYEYKE